MILFLHGAGSTSDVWKQLRPQINDDTSVLDYYHKNNFESTVSRVTDHIKLLGTVTLVGHSFGGIVAWHAARNCSNVRSIITISSPWNGVGIVEILNRMGILPHRAIFDANENFMKNISRSSYILKETREQQLSVPHLNIITTKGKPFLPRNDGLVEVSSQVAVKSLRNIFLDYNHYEVLRSQDLPGIIHWWHSGFLPMLERPRKHP